MNYTASISKFLLTAIVILISIGWAISAVMNFHASQEQVEELFDAELAQMSRILQAMITASMTRDAGGLSNTLEYLDEEVMAQEFAHREYSILGHKYEKKLAFQVWNQQGQILIKSHTGPSKPANNLQAGFQTLSAEQSSWRSFTLQDEHHGFWVQVAQQEDVRTELTNEIAWHSILPSLLFLPVLMVVSALIIRQGLSPLKRISNELKHRDYENLDQFDTNRYPVELEQMLSELNSLFQRVSESYQREKRFTADAAHELRTPLSIAKIHLQNIGQISTDETVIEFVNKALVGVDRLIHMVQQLLILSKLDAQVDQELDTQVDIRQLCQEAVEEITDSPEFNSISVAVHFPESIIIRSNETALRILLRNLLDNACRYADRGSTVQIKLEHTRLSIFNQCPTLEDRVLAKLFDRFSRGIATQQHGSGLGLSICQQVCQQLGFSLSIRNRSIEEQGRLYEGIETRVVFQGQTTTQL